MRAVVLVFGVLAASAGGFGEANAQIQTVERSVKAAPNRDTQIGVYLNVLPDCTFSALVTSRFATANDPNPSLDQRTFAFWYGLITIEPAVGGFDPVESVCIRASLCPGP